MDSYGKKLDQFADGKELVRLSKPLRDHADAACDACGSTQPRTLFCLKDTGTVRYFFVGDNCLKELLKRGVVKRRFGKEATPVAYQKEMERRSQEYGDDESKRHGGKNETTGTIAESLVTTASVPSAIKVNPLGHCGECYIIETRGEYHAFVAIVASDSPNRYWGYAMEVKYESTLRRGGERGLELDWLSTARPQALEHSLSKAMGMAYFRLQVSEQVPLIDEIHEMDEAKEIEGSSRQLDTPADATPSR